MSLNQRIQATTAATPGLFSRIKGWLKLPSLPKITFKRVVWSLLGLGLLFFLGLVIRSNWDTIRSKFTPASSSDSAATASLALLTDAQKNVIGETKKLTEGKKDEETVEIKAVDLLTLTSALEQAEKENKTALVKQKKDLERDNEVAISMAKKTFETDYLLKSKVDSDYLLKSKVESDYLLKGKVDNDYLLKSKVESDYLLKINVDTFDYAKSLREKNELISSLRAELAGKKSSDPEEVRNLQRKYNELHEENKNLKAGQKGDTAPLHLQISKLEAQVKSLKSAQFMADQLTAQLSQTEKELRELRASKSSASSASPAVPAVKTVQVKTVKFEKEKDGYLVRKDGDKSLTLKLGEKLEIGFEGETYTINNVYVQPDQGAGFLYVGGQYVYLPFHLKFVGAPPQITVGGKRLAWLETGTKGGYSYGEGEKVNVVYYSPAQESWKSYSNPALAEAVTAAWREAGIKVYLAYEGQEYLYWDGSK